MDNSIKEIIKNNINTSRLSITIYYFSFLILVCIGFIIFLVNTNYFNIYINYSFLVITPLLIIAAINDFSILLKKIWLTSVGKFIYAIVIYFSYSIATIYSEKAIYPLINFNIDSLQTSINLLSSFYMIPAIFFTILLLISFFSICYIILFFFSYLIYIIVNIPFLITKNFNSKFKIDLFKLISNFFSKNFNLNLKEFLIRGFMLSIIFLFICQFMIYCALIPIQNSFERTLVKPIIIFTSYNKNNHHCKNLSIKDNSLIKFIDHENISIVDVNFNLRSNNDLLNIKFKPIEKCEQFN